MMVEFAFFLDIWRQIFKKYNIKAFHQHQEFNFWSQIQLLAAKLEDGMSFSYFWSIQRIALAQFNYGYCDIFFSWGKLHRDFIEMYDFNYKYMLDIGTIFDSAYIDGQKEIPLSMDKKVNFVMLLFDVGSSPDTQFAPSQEKLFYETMLKITARHPFWGVVIKPKHRQSFNNFSRAGKIKELLDSLNQQKRCFVLDEDYNPFDVSYLADICVCHGINSAGGIVSLAGHKAIHWDLAGNSRHPYYLNQAHKNCIFTEKEKVEDALELLADNKDSSIGDHSAWFELLDPFRDAKAGLRAGQVIKNFLTDADKGLEREAALKKTVERYQQVWGNNRVFSFATRNERLKENIWIKAENTLRKS